MKTKLTKRLAMHRETLLALEALPDALLRVAGGRSVRSMCGTCPPGTCTSQQVASRCLAC
jgi:hypothetical protein